MIWKGLALLRPHKTGPVRLQPTPPPPLEMLISEDLKCIHLVSAWANSNSSSICTGVPISLDWTPTVHNVAA